MQNIKDMIALCEELSASDSLQEFAVRAAMDLIIGIGVFFSVDGPLLDQCIKSLREAGIRQPNSRTLSIPLAYSLILRFGEMVTDDDYEEAKTILNEIHGSSCPGNSIESWYQISSHLISLLAGLRSTRYKKPEHSEEAMSHLRSRLHSPFLPEKSRSDIIKLLDSAAVGRFRSFGVKESSALQDALSLNYEVFGPSSSRRLDTSRGDIAESHSVIVPHSTEAMSVDAGIQRLQKHLTTISPGTNGHRECLEQLVESYRTKISLTKDPTDIEEAIKHCRSLRDATSPGGMSSCHAAISLAHLLRLAFEHTHKIEDLNESINLLSGVLKIPAGRTLCDSVVEKLIASLFTRDKALLRKQDTRATQSMRETIQTVIEILPLAVDNRYISVPSRLRHSCKWSRSLRIGNQFGACSSSAVSTAYEKSMSLMRDCVVFAPNLHLQHTHFVAMIQEIETMPLDYASYQVDTGQLEQAIETLERGRALLWSELRGLRTSMHHISGVDPLLAEKFSAINRDLEKLTMSVLPNKSTKVNDKGDRAEDGDGVGVGVDPFGHLLMKQRKLLEQRDNVISQVRSLPGLQNFLMPPSFDALRSAASHGPVIIINHNEWHSDILILLYDSPPSLLPTSNGFYEDANRLRDDLLDARKKQGLDSIEYERALASVLENLYNLVGRPVIDRLHELNIPEQSRIWWCPTSVFCSLPLHAMGPVPSHDGMERYFSDLYIPSYTPTLSALIESRNPGIQLQSPRQPSLLLVAQPDSSLPGVKGEIQVIQRLDIEVESLILGHATTAAVIEGLKRHELVHFACHGNLEIGKPFDASFKLHGDEQLKLLDIVHSRLPTAEFAFLSACHTAELTEESIADEGLHLTAALQYCGFRSVVGTMWAMADTDGRDLARHVYRSMLSGNDDGPFYLRSAEALRDAVRRLRRTRGVTLERWVNFVHYGA